MTATTSCTDTIAPGDSAYDNAHAAEDIERLRSTWDVPALALLGIGNGAQVALAYAGSHPDKVARLVLDSPLPLGIAAEAAAEQQVKGRAGRAGRVRRAVRRRQLPAGPRPEGRRRRAAGGRARRPRARRRVGRRRSPTRSAPRWRFPRGDRVSRDQQPGHRAGRGALRRRQPAEQPDQPGRDRCARPTASSSTRCSDALNRPTPDRVRELVVAWAKLYPQFGAVGALNLVKCLNWPSGTPPQEPKNLKIHVLLLGVQNDPIVGNEGVAARRRHHHQRRRRQQAGDVAGHRARRERSTRRARCRRSIGYLDSGKLPADRHVLPRLSPRRRGRRCTVRWWRHLTPSVPAC